MTVLKGKLGFKGEGATIDISEKVDGVVTITSTDNRGTQTTTISDGEITTAMIIDDLTHTSTDKPLSANQGKVLKGYIDANSDAIAAIAQTIYPVGSLYYSASSTNPSSDFGGTWTEVPCHEIIESGTITTSRGITLGQCEYRLYANGDLEVFGYTQSHSVDGLTQTLSSVTMPYTTTWGAINIDVAYGSADWPTVGLFGYTDGNQLNFSEWQNVATTATNFQFAFRAICKVDLETNNIDTIHCFKRTA